MEFKAYQAINLGKPLSFLDQRLFKNNKHVKISRSRSGFRVYYKPSGAKSSFLIQDMIQDVKGDIAYDSKGNIEWKKSVFYSISQYSLAGKNSERRLYWRAVDLASIDGSKIYKLAVGSGSSRELLQKSVFSGNDIITGSFQRDTLVGGDGNDKITGRRGGDRLTGNGGSDIFIYDEYRDSVAYMSKGKLVPRAKNIDTITDFDGKSGDKINLRKINAVASTDSLTFIGTAQFSGAAGEVRFDQSVGALQVDIGDKKAFMYISLSGYKGEAFDASYLIL